MKTIIRSTSLLAAFFAPALASAALYIGNDSRDISSVADTVLYIINGILVPVLFGLAFIVFIYGVAKTYIFSTGDEGKVKEGHQLILWGIIGFVVMISLWGLVNVVANTFGLAGNPPPDLPFSPPSSLHGPGY